MSDAILAIAFVASLILAEPVVEITLQALGL